jgi:hypothetical protein
VFLLVVKREEGTDGGFPALREISVSWWGFLNGKPTITVIIIRIFS